MMSVVYVGLYLIGLGAALRIADEEYLPPSVAFIWPLLFPLWVGARIADRLYDK